MSPPNAPGKVPNYDIIGQPIIPEVLSNKIILTPVSLGNTRGGLWSHDTLKHATWTADIDFRASGPERAGGNLNIWIAKDGEKSIASNSVYGAGRFEGLAIIIDTHGGSGGMIRGFLNDGKVDYSQHHSVDKLAFGHCQYAYRNLGRPSQLKIRQTSDTFKVEIDSKLCFESHKLILPTGYHIGVTAATPDNPDSFEIFKLVVMSEGGASNGNNHNKNNQRYEYADRKVQIPPASNPPSGQQAAKDDSFPQAIPDQDADVFQTSKTQFQDLHNRLQSSHHQISAVYRAVSTHHQMDETRHHEMKEFMAKIQSQLGKLDQISDLQRRIGELEKEMKSLHQELGYKIQDHDTSFRGYLSDHHATISQTMLDRVPGHGKLIFIIIGSQVFLAAAYVLYKRRKASMPKKYL